MPSRAKGMSLGRRRWARRNRRRPETRHRGNDPIVMVEKPDKTGGRKAAQLRSRVIVSLGARLEYAACVFRRAYSALSAALLARCKVAFVVVQIQYLCGDASNAGLRHCSLHDLAGGTTGLRAAQLLLCTATTRGKDDHHREPFPGTGGEIYFCWAGFWTARKQTTRRPDFPVVV